MVTKDSVSTNISVGKFPMYPSNDRERLIVKVNPGIYIFIHCNNILLQPKLNKLVSSQFQVLLGLPVWICFGLDLSSA